MKQGLLAAYEANLAGSPYRGNLLRYARAFLETAPDLHRASIDQYLAILTETSSPGTVNYAFRVLRRLYAVNNLPWPYQRGEAPAIKERDEYRPQLDPSVVADLVSAAKAGRLYPQEACFLALSTTYMLRREEICNIGPRDVDLQERFLYVATVKSGRERYHLIPGEIIPILGKHDFSEHYAVSTASTMFQRILRKGAPYISAKEAKGLGWHAIRRAVAQGLADNGLSPLALIKFGRWRTNAGDMAMPVRYYGNVVVGKKKRAVTDEAKSDEEAFEKHPFLPLWRDDA